MKYDILQAFPRSSFVFLPKEANDKKKTLKTLFLFFLSLSLLYRWTFQTSERVKLTLILLRDKQEGRSRPMSAAAHVEGILFLSPTDVDENIYTSLS